MASTKRRTKYYGASEAVIWPADYPKSYPRKTAKVRKDTKRWCHGKIGVEHKPVIGLKHGWEASLGCKPTNEWQRKLWPKRLWACVHDERCEHCGKILRRQIEAAECPDYPGPS